MTLIARTELTYLTGAELAALFALISRELTQAKPGSLEWEEAMMSLENIRREQAKRRGAMQPRPQPRGPGL
jgi:hypothetical protein